MSDAPAAAGAELAEVAGLVEALGTPHRRQADRATQLSWHPQPGIARVHPPPWAGHVPTVWSSRFRGFAKAGRASSRPGA
eukprot:1980880-Lingulodinium_polyedra.AAC.1